MLHRIGGLLLLALAAGGPSAAAQDQPAPANPVLSDPAAVLAGLWQVDRVEGDYDTASSLIGRTMRIDRDSVASLTGGTCSHPGFGVEPATGLIAVSCLGQVLARADWNGAAPETLLWAEPNVQAVLHRVAVPAATDGAGQDESGGGAESGDANGSDANGEGDAQ